MRGAAFHDLAGVHDHDIIRHVVQQGQLMGDEDHALDHSGRQHVLQHLDDHLLARHVQGGGRFIRDQDLRAQDGGNRDDDALPHAAGELHAVFVQRVHRQAQLREAFLRHRADLFLVHGQFMGADHVLDELPDFPGGVHGVHGRLRNVGDFRAQHGFAHHVRIHAGNVFPVDDDLAALVMQRGEIVTHQAQRQGRFAAAGFAGDAQALALFDVQGHMVHGVYILALACDVFGGQLMDLKNFLRHFAFPPQSRRVGLNTWSRPVFIRFREKEISAITRMTGK